MLSISSKNMEVLPTQPRQPEMKRADNKDQKLFTNREMKQRTTEILKNSIKPKPQLESRTVLQQKHEEFRQEPVLTKKSQDYNITDMTKFSLPVGALQNNMRNQIKQKSTPTLSAYTNQAWNNFIKITYTQTMLIFSHYFVQQFTQQYYVIYSQTQAVWVLQKYFLICFCPCCLSVCVGC